MDDNVTKDNPLIADYHSKNKIYQFRYYELGNYDHLDLKKIQQIYGVCFYQDKMVIVLNGKKKTWGLVGGKPGDGENIQQTLEREISQTTLGASSGRLCRLIRHRKTSPTKWCAPEIAAASGAHVGHSRHMYSVDD